MSHFYDAAAKEPRHFVEKKSGGGNRPTTIADARKFGWYPGVTTILAAADRHAFTEWKMRNAAMAAVTTPRLDGESLDAFVERILSVDAQDESTRAKDRGLAIHDAISLALDYKKCDPLYEPYVTETLLMVADFGVLKAHDLLVFGDRYGGVLDALFQREDLLTVVDFKTCTRLPTKSYFDHRCQLAAYAMAMGNVSDCRIQTANVYLCTSAKAVAVFTHPEWQTAGKAFLALAEYWRLVNQWTEK